MAHILVNWHQGILPRVLDGAVRERRGVAEPSGKWNQALTWHLLSDCACHLLGAWSGRLVGDPLTHGLHPFTHTYLLARCL